MIAVVINDVPWQMELDPDSECGLQVVPFISTGFEQVPGDDAWRGGFYVSKGTGTPTSVGAAGRKIRSPRWLPTPWLKQATEDVELDPVPEWMIPQTLVGKAQTDARQFERQFNLNDAAELLLPEMAAAQKPEMARMATKCLGLIGAQPSLMPVLLRSQHEAVRLEAISELTLWLPRRPENWELLKDSLSKQIPPDDAATVYKLLWGFDADAATDKVLATQLIDWMGSPELAIRELAFYHVSRLTDKRFGYRANLPPDRLNSSLKSWRLHLKRVGRL